MNVHISFYPLQFIYSNTQSDKMKAATVYLSLLSLLVASDAWFIDFNKSAGKKEKENHGLKATQPPRKVVLVAKTVYVPVYASGDKSTPLSDQLSPIAPVLAAPGAVMGMLDGRQQQQPFDYSPMYLQPPPATYLMYNAGSSDVAAAYAAPVPVPADVYGAAGPQYVQYAAASPQESWVMQYGTGEAEAPAAPYSPTGSEVTEGPTEAPTEAYTTV